jgi:spore maturation protein CgeB
MRSGSGRGDPRMKLVVFGLTVSSAWGAGRAAFWRGLIRALGRRCCEVVFFERDQPWCASHRDLHALEGGELKLYADWAGVLPAARRAVREADAAMVTSYCPDGVAAARLIRDEARGSKVFYDMDASVTLARVQAGERPDYLPPEGLSDFDLVLSGAGGEALRLLREQLGARRTAPLYGHVDPDVCRPAEPDPAFAADLSFIGAWAADRQAALETLFVEPARRRPGKRFVLAGSGYPAAFPWTENIWHVRHLPPGLHPAFFAASRLTLNVTRADMAAYGWRPSGRLFEAAACGAPVLTDRWPGLEDVFEPGREILTADGVEDALAALELGDAELAAIGAAARERTLQHHTSDRRAEELIGLLSTSDAREGGGLSHMARLARKQETAA